MNNFLGTEFLMFEESGSTYNLFAGASSHSFEISGDILDAPSKDAGQWLEKIYGRSNWTASMDALVTFSDEYNLDYFIQKKINKEKITVVFALNDGDNEPDTTKNFYKGVALIETISANFPDQDNSTYTVSLQGSGALEKPE
ncbi:MAG: phage tail tube protein [bacterium]